MYLHRVTFGPAKGGDRDELADLALDYLSMLLRSGQACSVLQCAWRDGILFAYTRLGGHDAQAWRRHSKYGKAELRKVEEAFGQMPQWTPIDDEMPRRNPSWRSAPFLYLFTHAFDWTYPVCRGDGPRPCPPISSPFRTRSETTCTAG